MAALDYQRLRQRLPRARLLFVAHREEILTQSRNTFAHALRDASFGELWVGGRRPEEYDHVFASIQSLNATGAEPRSSSPPRHTALLRRRLWLGDRGGGGCQGSLFRNCSAQLISQYEN
jgi:superfamily II DNA or RNA helicase